LFNFFDNMPYGVMGEKYRHSPPGRAFSLLLRQIGELKTINGLCRRHVVSNYDTKAPSETAAATLPCDLPAGGKAAFKICSGPKPLRGQKGQIRLVVQEAETAKPQQLNVWVNGQQCPWVEKIPSPRGVVGPMQCFGIPTSAITRGDTEVRIGNPSATSLRLLWLELALSDFAGAWPNSDVDTAELEPE
jgi:hypothetical protein